MKLLIFIGLAMLDLVSSIPTTGKNSTETILKIHKGSKSKELDSAEKPGSTPIASESTTTFPIPPEFRPRKQPPVPRGPSAPPGNPPFVDASLQFSKLVDSPQQPGPAIVPRNGENGQFQNQESNGNIGANSDDFLFGGENGTGVNGRIDQDLHIDQIAHSDDNVTERSHSAGTKPFTEHGPADKSIATTSQVFESDKLKKVESGEKSHGEESENGTTISASKPKRTENVTDHHQIIVVAADFNASEAPGQKKHEPNPPSVNLDQESISTNNNPAKAIKSKAIVANSGRGKCPYAVPGESDKAKKCTFQVIKGKTLNIFTGDHPEVSLCETLVLDLDQCQAMCAEVDECRAVHFCPECVEHNCRLLSEQQNGPSKLELVDRFVYVDYSEKAQCT